MANAWLLAQAVLKWHETDDKSTVCIKTRQPTYLTDTPVLVDTVEPEQPEALKSDVEMTEPFMKPALIDDEDDDDDEPALSSQVIEEYHQMIHGFDAVQPVFTILDETHNLDALFPELVLYTAPDPECIGNDPYFDEAEYSRVVPFKLSATNIVFQKSRKRYADGTHVQRYDTDVTSKY